MTTTRLTSFFYDTNIWKHFFLLIIFSNFILFLDSSLVLTFSLFLIFSYIFLKLYSSISNFYFSKLSFKKKKFENMLLSLNKNYIFFKKLNLTLIKFPNNLSSLILIWFFNYKDLKFNKPPVYTNYSIFFSKHFITFFSKKYNNMFFLDFNDKNKTTFFLKKTF